MPWNPSLWKFTFVVTVLLGACSGSASEADGGPTPLPESDILTPINAGVRSVETFDQPFTLDYPDGWYRVVVAANFFATEPAADFDLVFMQPSELNDPTDLGFPGLDFEPWDVADFDGWLQAIPQELIVAGPEEQVVAGLPATRVELEVTDESICASEDFCIGFARTSIDGNGRPMEPGRRYVKYWIELEDGQLPFVISAALPSVDEGDTVRNQFGSLLDSLDLSGP